MSTLRIKSRDPFWGTVQYLSKIVPSQHVRTFDAQFVGNSRQNVCRYMPLEMDMFWSHVCNSVYLTEITSFFFNFV